MTYKILVLKNSPSIDVTDECKKTEVFFNTRPKPIQVQFTIQDVSIPVAYKVYKTAQGFNSITGTPAQINQMGLVDSVKDTIRTLVKEFQYSEVMFISDVSSLPNDGISAYENFTTFKPLYFNTGFTQIAYSPYRKQNGEVLIAIKHEPMHDFCYTLNRYGYPVLDEMDIDHLGRPYYRNDFPEDVNSNFGETFANMAPYLDKLVPQNMQATTGTYKYFKDSEIVGLKPELVQLLDQARDIAGVPFIITSGYRDPAHNAAVGGVMDSAHETGLAVDLLVKDGISGEKINAALHQVGIKRFGYYTDGHIHCDIDYSKPNPCYWIK